GSTPVPLSLNESGPGANDNNYGSGTGCTGGMTVFDGAAPLQIFQGVNPYDGSWRTDSTIVPLAYFHGGQTKGTDRLPVNDTAGGDTGTITCFQLTVKYKPA